MSAEILRRAAGLMRERAEAVRDYIDPDQGWWSRFGMAGALQDAEPNMSDEEVHFDAAHIASWHPAVALAVAKAMDDVAHAWEICDEGWTRDMDDDAIRFDETVDAGWVNVARAYLDQPFRPDGGE